MMKVTIGSLFSAEGWLELEAHESDLRGSRGIAIAGALMLFMGVLNFKNTVRLPPCPPPQRGIMPLPSFLDTSYASLIWTA